MNSWQSIIHSFKNTVQVSVEGKLAKQIKRNFVTIFRTFSNLRGILSETDNRFRGQNLKSEP